MSLIALTKVGTYDQHGTPTTVSSETIYVESEAISSIETHTSGATVMLQNAVMIDAAKVHGYIVSESPAAIAVLAGVLASGTQTLTGAGAVNVTQRNTLLVTTGANALTLANGSEGQLKFIRMKTDGGDGTLTPVSLQGGTTITFNDAGDFVELYFLDGKWNIISNSGCTVA